MHQPLPSVTLAAAVFLATPALAADPDRWKPLAPAEDVWFQANVTLHYHVLPDAMLDRAYSHHPRFEGFAPGVEIALKKEGFQLIGLFAYTLVTTPDSVWLEAGDAKAQAVWVEQDLKLVTFGVVFAYEFSFAEAIGIMPGVGFTPVFIQGGARQTPTEGHPDDAVEDRTPNPNHPGKPFDIRPRKMLSPDLSVRLRIRPVERLLLSVDFGWRTYVYLGASVGFKVP